MSHSHSLWLSSFQVYYCISLRAWHSPRCLTALYWNNSVWFQGSYFLSLEQLSVVQFVPYLLTGVSLRHQAFPLLLTELALCRFMCLTVTHWSYSACPKCTLLLTRVDPCHFRCLIAAHLGDFVSYRCSTATHRLFLHFLRCPTSTTWGRFFSCQEQHWSHWGGYAFFAGVPLPLTKLTLHLFCVSLLLTGVASHYPRCYNTFNWGEFLLSHICHCHSLGFLCDVQSVS